MIKDKLANCETYYGISARLKQGFEWLISQDLKNIACGKYEIDGSKLYANIQEYETRTEADFEAHKNYIDIQYIVKGEEAVSCIEKNDCYTTKEYDSKTDLEFLKSNKKEEYFSLREGEFVVFYPQDAHKPSMDNGTKSFVKKVVVKVCVN